MSHMLALLTDKRTRRVPMYVGTNSLRKFADFLRGYEHAVYRLLPGHADPFLGKFRDWIYERFQTNENISWEEVILRHSPDEDEAVKRFWELLDEYLREQGRENPAATALGSANGIGLADLSIKGQGK